MKADGKNHRVSVTLDGYRPFEEEVTFSVEKGDVDLFAKLKREKKKSSKGEKREGEAAGEEVKKAIEEKKAPSAAKPAPPGEAEKKPGTGKKKKGEEIARDIDV
jgi:hypothetical protein